MGAEVDDENTRSDEVVDRMCDTAISEMTTEEILELTRSLGVASSRKSRSSGDVFGDSGMPVHFAGTASQSITSPDIRGRSGRFRSRWRQS